MTGFGPASRVMLLGAVSMFAAGCSLAFAQVATPAAAVAVAAGAPPDLAGAAAGVAGVVGGVGGTGIVFWFGRLFEQGVTSVKNIETAALEATKIAKELQTEIKTLNGQSTKILDAVDAIEADRDLDTQERSIRRQSRSHARDQRRPE